jgi:hypothetical protein
MPATISRVEHRAKCQKGRYAGITGMARKGRDVFLVSVALCLLTWCPRLWAVCDCGGTGCQVEECGCGGEGQAIQCACKGVGGPCTGEGCDSVCPSGSGCGLTMPCGCGAQQGSCPCVKCTREADPCGGADGCACPCGCGRLKCKTGSNPCGPSASCTCGATPGSCTCLEKPCSSAPNPCGGADGCACPCGCGRLKCKTGNNPCVPTPCTCGATPGSCTCLEKPCSSAPNPCGGTDPCACPCSCGLLKCKTGNNPCVPTPCTCGGEQGTCPCPEKPCPTAANPCGAGTNQAPHCACRSPENCGGCAKVCPSGGRLCSGSSFYCQCGGGGTCTCLMCSRDGMPCGGSDPCEEENAVGCGGGETCGCGSVCKDGSNSCGGKGCSYDSGQGCSGSGCTDPETACSQGCKKGSFSCGGAVGCNSGSKCCNGVTNDYGDCSYCPAGSGAGCSRMNCDPQDASCCNTGPQAQVKCSDAFDSPNCMLHCSNQASICGGVNLCNNTGCAADNCSYPTDCIEYCKRTTQPCSGKDYCKCKSVSSGGTTFCERTVCEAEGLLCNNANPKDCVACDGGTQCCCRAWALSTTCCDATKTKCTVSGACNVNFSPTQWSRCCRSSVDKNWGTCSGRDDCVLLGYGANNNPRPCISAGGQRCTGHKEPHLHITENIRKASCLVQKSPYCMDYDDCPWHYDWSWFLGTGGCCPWDKEYETYSPAPPAVNPSCTVTPSGCNCPDW